MTPTAAFELTIRLSCVGVIISSIELIWLRPHLSGGILAYRPWLAQPSGTLGRISGRAFGAVLEPRMFLCAVAIRAAAAAYLVVTPTPTTATSPAIVSILAVSLLLQFRNPYGLDGSDQMSLVVFGGLSVVTLAPGNEVLLYAGLAFITGQVYLAYATAGVAKLVSAAWRSGTALAGILTTETYGHPSLGRLLRRSRPAFIAGAAWSVIVFECFFPFATVTSQPSLVAALIVGALFHATTAYIMGLNSFFWSFVATYPAVACIGSQIQLLG